MRRRIGGFLALGVLAIVGGTPQAMAQATGDAAMRADVYRQASRELKELGREARLARGGPPTACVRFEQLVGSLTESLGPRSVLHRETLMELRSRFAAIVNRGCPEGTPRTFLIDGETGAIRDSGPRPPARFSSTPKAGEPVRTAPAPVAQPDPPAPPPTPPRADRSSLIGARAAVRVAGETCDPVAYQAAKDRLLNLLDALIADEPDEDRSQALIRERDEVRRLVPPACDPEESILDEIEERGRPRRPRGLPSLQEEAYLPMEFWFDAGAAEIPPTGIGVTRDGASGQAPETDAGLTRDKISTIGFGGAFGFGRVRVRAHYVEGDASTAFDVQPISGGFNGAVFGASSESGSSGTGAGSATLAGATAVDLSQFGLGVDLTVAQPTPATRLYFSFDYFRRVQHHDLSLTGTVSTVQFSQERDQRVRDHGFGVGIGAEARLPLHGSADGGTGLSARLTGRVQAYRLDSDLRSAERNVSNFGPASDRDFTIEIADGDNGFGVAAVAGAELDYAVSPGFSIFAGGTVGYRSRVSAVFNPNSGDQVFFDGLTTGLTRDDFWSYGARIGIRIGGGAVR